jgi:hypothetical protein
MLGAYSDNSLFINIISIKTESPAVGKFNLLSEDEDDLSEVDSFVSLKDLL